MRIPSRHMERGSGRRIRGRHRLHKAPVGGPVRSVAHGPEEEREGDWAAHELLTLCVRFGVPSIPAGRSSFDGDGSVFVKALDDHVSQFQSSSSSSLARILLP